MDKEMADIIFIVPSKNIYVELEVPLYISANEFVLAMNEAYHLGINVNDTKRLFFKAEYPIALIKGNKKLADFGVRNATRIYYTE